MLVLSLAPGACDSPQARARACSRSPPPRSLHPPSQREGCLRGLLAHPRNSFLQEGKQIYYQGTQHLPGRRGAGVTMSFYLRGYGSGAGLVVVHKLTSHKTHSSGDPSARSPWEFPCLWEHCYPPPRCPRPASFTRTPCGGSTRRLRSTVSDSPSIFSRL